MDKQKPKTLVIARVEVNPESKRLSLVFEKSILDAFIAMGEPNIKTFFDEFSHLVKYTESNIIEQLSKSEQISQPEIPDIVA